MHLLSKLLLVAAVVSALAFTTESGRYARVVYQEIVDYLDGRVPTRIKLAALKNDLKDIDRAINKQKGVVAERRVEAARAKAALADAEDAVADLHRELKGIKKDIDSAAAIGAATSEMKQKFTAAYARLEQAEARAAESEKAVAHTGKLREAAEAELREALSTRDELSRAVEALEAKYAEVRVAESRARSGGAESDVAALMSRIADLNSKLDVQKARADRDAPKPAAPAECKEFDKAMKEYKVRVDK